MDDEHFPRRNREGPAPLTTSFVWARSQPDRASFRDGGGGTEDGLAAGRNEGPPSRVVTLVR